MITFIKDSIRELKHVVWPTREETKNYFFVVVIVLIIFGLYLFLVSTLFTEMLFGLKDLVGIDSAGTTVNTIDAGQNVEILPETITTDFTVTGATQ